jgi:hypothetical protein
MKSFNVQSYLLLKITTGHIARVYRHFFSWLRLYSENMGVYWLGELVDLRIYIIMAKFGKNDDGE